MTKSSKENAKLFQLYSSFKFDIQKLVDSLLAPFNSDSSNVVDFVHDTFVLDSILRIEVEMPGVEEENLLIEGLNNCIQISGVKNTIKSKYPTCVALERAAGTFKKVIYLDQTVNMQKAKAKLYQGLLIVEIPIIVEKRGKRIIQLR